MALKKWKVRLRRFGNDDSRWLALSACQRIELMWSLTVEGWQLLHKRGLHDAERVLQRDSVRVVGRGR